MSDTASEPAKPVCAEAECGLHIWWNPRKRVWLHYWEPQDHPATILRGS